mgnify:CR=1 FL=1
MPYPTIKPLFVALFMTLMFALPAADPRRQDCSSAVARHHRLRRRDDVRSCTAWLTSPLEPHHH